MKIYILYHGNCPDGFGSAWSAYTYLNTVQNPDAEIEYIPVVYGTKFPEIEDGSYVYMLDFSTDAETLRKLGEKNRIVILDHHKTAKAGLVEFPTLAETHTVNDEKYEEMPYGVFVRFNMKKSGAMLSWEFFNPGKRVPKLIEYVQDRDLWNHKLEGTKEFSAHLRSFNFTFEEWNKVNNLTETSSTFKKLESFIETGKTLVLQDQRNIDMICSQAKVIDYNGYRVAVVCASSHWSDVGDSLVKLYPEADYSLAFYYSPKNNLIKMSLRCGDSFDVSEVASLFGGGGHQKAAGYVLRGSAMVDFLNKIDEM